MPVSEPKSVVTRQRILDAAAKAFAEQSYTSVRLSDIAELAGMQAGSLYYHFESKTALIDELLQVSLELTWQHVRDGMDELADATPVARLEAALRIHSKRTLHDSDYAKAHARIIGSAPLAIRQRRVKLERAYGAYFHKLFEAAAAQMASNANLFVARMLALGAVNYTTEWYKPGGALSADEIVDIAVDTIMRGMFGSIPDDIVKGRRRPAKSASKKAVGQPKRNGQTSNGQTSNGQKRAVAAKKTRARRPVAT